MDDRHVPKGDGALRMITFSRLGRYGQIGNQMFQIAGTVGIARKYGYTYGFPKWVNHDGIAKGNMTPEEAYIGGWFAHPLPLASDREIRRCRPVEVPWGYHDRFNPGGNADLIGHMQSERWFAHCDLEIREVFEWAQPPPRIDAVAIHVRRGDYDGAYHNLLGEAYYHEAMQIMHERGHKRFVVFSDDTEEAKRVTGISPMELDDPMMSLRMMTGYAGHIIANSSFSWWGAWLANSADVVAPSQWVGDVANLDTSAIVPHRWTKL
jgi:hypothetical protein